MPESVQINTAANPIVVSREVYRNQEYLGIRFYYTDAVTGELRPDKRGINIPVQFAPAVQAAIEKMLAPAKKSKPKSKR
jgi:hypothetical protein